MAVCGRSVVHAEFLGLLAREGRRVGGEAAGREGRLGAGARCCRGELARMAGWVCMGLCVLLLVSSHVEFPQAVRAACRGTMVDEAPFGGEDST